MIWERKELCVLWRWSLDHMGERERERKQHTGDAQEKQFPKITDWENEKGSLPQVFINNGAEMSEISEVHAIAGVETVGIVVRLLRRSAEAQEQTPWSEDPLGSIGRGSSPPWSTTGKSSTHGCS